MAISSKKVPEVSIIVPAYNESKGIGITLEKLKNMAQPNRWEIIVVDDGSTDDTHTIAESYKVKVIRHKRNLGYGASLKTGIRQAIYEIICITDADGTYPSSAIPMLVQDLVNHEQDMVVGARTGHQVKIPKARSMAKWFLKKLSDWIVEDNIPDFNSGLRVIRRNALDPFLRFLSDGFSFTTTITLAMHLNDYQVTYHPIDYHARKGKSKIRPIRDTANFIKLIFRIGLYFAPLKIFLPLSGIIILFAIAWGAFTIFVLDRFADASTLTIVMAGIQIAMIGLLAELINQRTYDSHRK
ncbi:glycosyltransferase family 2 protein [bacterium]|nr:glycosyltransferase family 2 protein [bacterium]